MNFDLVEKLEGIHTLDSVISILKIKKSTAIKLISQLRKQGYVRTKQIKSKKRVYYISRLNLIGGKSYCDVINSVSNVKISESSDPKVYGRNISFEEALVYAIKTRRLRTILAALALFKKIKNWKILYKLGKENNICRQIGVLYDLSKILMKVRAMPRLYRKNMLPKSNDKFIYIIDRLRSDDFKIIEKTWKVYLSFNKSDLVEL